MDSKTLNILIPMAGRGMRFKEYERPKPFIDVLGKPMIQRVIENIGEANYIFITHSKYYELPGLVIISDQVTEGPACSALLALDWINNDQPLIIVNCDQIIRDFDLSKFLEFAEDCDGVLGCFISHSPKNSYVKLDANGLVTEVKEKIVISNIATNGLHYWKRGSLFVDSANKMIEANDRYNNEFYIAPTYNYMIKDGAVIKPYFFNLHCPIGTPEDLEAYKLKYGSKEDR